MKIEKNKKNLIAAAVFTAVMGFGTVSYFVFAAPDNDRVLIKANPAPTAVDVPVIVPTVVDAPVPIKVNSPETEPVTLDLSFTLPMTEDAQKLLDHSRDLSIQKVRALALAEKAKGDKLDGTNQPLPQFSQPSIPVMVPDLNGDFDSSIHTESLPKKVISEQVTVKGIVRVGGKLSAIVGLGDQIVPVRVGTKFSGVQVIKLTDTSITLREGEKRYTRYLNKQIRDLKETKSKGV